MLPWEAEDDATREELKAKVLQLTEADHRKALAIAPPLGFTQSTHLTMPMALAAAEADKNVFKAREKVVKYGASDKGFWRSYFYHGTPLLRAWARFTAVQCTYSARSTGWRPLAHPLPPASA